MTLASAIVLLFLVIDPFGNVPFFMAALKDVDPARRRHVIVRELLIAYAVMVVFLFVGQPLLQILGISGPALTIAGGVILFLIALRMVFPIRGQNLHEDVDGEPFIVPLAIPCVAGPSSMATLMLLGASHPQSQLLLLGALGLAWSANLVIVLSAVVLMRYLGKRTLIALERLMGMLLVTLSVQMFLDGVGRYLNP